VSPAPTHALAAPCTQPLHQRAVVQRQKRVVRLVRGEAVAIRLQRFGIQVFETEAFQHRAVLRLVAGVAQHLPHLGLGAVAIAFEIALVGAGQRIAVDEHRPLRARGPAHPDQQQFAAIDRHQLHVALGADRRAELLRVVVPVPERLDQLGGRTDADDLVLVALLGHAQHHGAAFGVGERGDRLPKRLRQAALGELELDVLVFAEIEALEKVLGVHRRGWWYGGRLRSSAIFRKSR
jgi:hypothetical protein